MAAVLPFSQEMMSEDTILSYQQNMIVTINEQVNSCVLEKRSPETLLRQRSLSLNAPSTTDHANPSVAMMMRSDKYLRRSMSASLNPDWKLGDSWLRLRHEKGSALQSRIGASSVTSIPGLNQQDREIQGAANSNDDETKKCTFYPLKEWRNGQLREPRGDGNDFKCAFADSQGLESSNISEVENWITSPCHLDNVSDARIMSNDATCTDSYALSVDKLSGNREVSPAGQLDSVNEPLSSRWREIQGARNWECLVDPLDIDLRREILRYGDFAQTTYDNLVCEARSKYAGSARYSKQNMFTKLHNPDNGYEVTRYLYATCRNPLPGVLQSSLSSERWDVESNWMGYVAVATNPQEIKRLGRRDIVVAWRGTVRTIEWLLDAQIQMVSLTSAAELTGLCPNVEKGFWSLYKCKRSTSQFNQNSASEQVIAEIARLLKHYSGENLSITITGHSLGGALAILTAYEIAASGLNKSSAGQEEIIPLTVFTFGSPHVGDAVFKKKFKELHIKALRVVECHDLVPKTIPRVYFPWMETYEHVGVELQVDHTRSPYLKRSFDPLDWHSLECHLHLVDGHQGRMATSFELITGRDYALLNKYADILEASYCAPPSWWQVENKGMELSSQGRWCEPDRSLEDTPSLLNHERFV